MMSQARFDALHGGLNSAAQKVYAAVPKAEAWGVKQIVCEMMRRNTNMDFKIIVGCLDTLRRMGLVKEPSKGMFQCEPVRVTKQKTESQETQEEEEMQATVKPAPTAHNSALTQEPKPPIDRLGDLAQRAAQMSDMLKELASEISDAAIDMQTQMEANADDLTKFKQLQTVLKSIGSMPA